jgi:hypothetical protein
MRNRTCRIGRAGALPGLLLLLASAAITPGAASAGTGRTPAAQPSLAAVRASLAAARVPFVGNEGQIPDAGVKFYARTFAGTVFVTSRADLVYALPVAGREHAIWALRESFVGHRPTRVRGGAASSERVGVYRGADPAAWRPRLGTFDDIDLGELYPGVRATLRVAGDNVEKRFHVAPGADAGAIEVEVDGVASLAVDSGGRLVAKTAIGDVLLTAPVAYQTVAGERRPVEVAYALAGGDRYGFRLGAHDPDREVVIDPLLAATYLGGHNPNAPGNYDDDWIYDLLTVGDDVYVGGVTQSPDFPIVLGYDDTLASSSPEGFVARMSGDLSQVLASTYIGTTRFDRVSALALGSDGSILAAGQAGYGFPVTPGAYTWSGSTPVGGGFVLAFSPDLATLEASAVPTPQDFPSRIAPGNGPEGGIYFAGTTNDPAVPITPGAYLDHCCPPDGFGNRPYNGFAGRLSSDFTTLESMTYLGGNIASGLAVAPDGKVFLTDGFDEAIDGYISRFDADLTTREEYLDYYPGTTGYTRTYFNAVTVADGRVYTGGQTYQADLPATEGAFDTTCGTDGQCDGVGPLNYPQSDGFVAIYSEDLQTTYALTFLGGSGNESVRSIALAPGGDVLVTGETTSTDFPTGGDGADTTCGTDGLCNPVGMYQHPTPDAFLVRLTPDLAQLGYGTYLGGSDEEHANVVRAADDGTVYTAGYTRSSDFPATDGAFDQSYNGGTSDAFIAAYDTGTGSVPDPTIFDDGFESGDMTGWSGVGN